MLRYVTNDSAARPTRDNKYEVASEPFMDVKTILPQ